MGVEDSPTGKPWYKSLTKWGALLAVIAKALQNPRDPATLTEALATGFTIWGARNALGQVITAVKDPEQ